MTRRDRLGLTRHRVLDGGMASELEFLGADIRGPLWSAHVLEDAPEKVLAVHRVYLEAGADVLLTASYQVSRKGYSEYGLAPERADAALLRSVELADAARREFPEREVLVAASLGPYGAALHDGSEYHGNYNCTFGELVQFHRERIAVLAGSDADVLAFETIPSLEEARAIGEALKQWADLAVWLSFTCRSATEVAHGELVRVCADLAASLPQTVAIGVNCTQPALLNSLIDEIKAVTDKPIVVYPNSGEGWDAAGRCWTGSSDPAEFGAQAQEWFDHGAQIVGGCCRTRPAHIRKVSEQMLATGRKPGRAEII